MRPIATNRRKHISQMTEAEVNTVSQYVHGLQFFANPNNDHLQERKGKWNLTDKEIVDALQTGELVEAHSNNYPEIRFVMRKDMGTRAVCVCAKKNGEIVTAWVNHSKDLHATLRKSDYQWNVDLTRVFKA